MALNGDNSGFDWRRVSLWRSIRARLTFSHLAVIVVAMGLSGLLLLSLLEGYYVRAMEDSLAAQAQITVQALVPGARVEMLPADASSAAYNTVQQQLWSNLSIQAENLAASPGESSLDVDSLANVTLQLSSQLETRIRILDTRGIVLVDSRQESQGADLSGNPLVTQALTGQYAGPSVPLGPA
ncbi:MAG: hypothetical protein PVH95_07075, partial [Anaerolineae bacterium]